LKKEVIELKEHLKKYTFGDNHKRYYEKNKEKVKEGGAKYLQKLKEENPEKLREYWRRAYQNRKQRELIEKNDKSYINK
jgi:predicted MPP superfamily phosphohydrolase